MIPNSSTALITGGTSGIGRATANKLAQLGVHVLLVGRNKERGEKAVAEIRAAGGNADSHPPRPPGHSAEDVSVFTRSGPA